jgi:hypothetical protein
MQTSGSGFSAPSLLFPACPAIGGHCACQPPFLFPFQRFLGVLAFNTQTHFAVTTILLCDSHWQKPLCVREGFDGDVYAHFTVPTSRFSGWPECISSAFHKRPAVHCLVHLWLRRDWTSTRIAVFQHAVPFKHGNFPLAVCLDPAICVPLPASWPSSQGTVHSCRARMCLPAFPHIRPHAAVCQWLYTARNLRYVCKPRHEFLGNQKHPAAYLPWRRVQYKLTSSRLNVGSSTAIAHARCANPSSSS